MLASCIDWELKSIAKYVGVYSLLYLSLGEILEAGFRSKGLKIERLNNRRLGGTAAYLEPTNLAGWLRGPPAEQVLAH